MKILRFYLAKSFALSYFLLFGLVCATFAVSNIFDVLQKFRDNPLPFDIFLQLIFLKLPYLIGEVSAFLAFFATIHFFYKLSSSKQLTILLTSGIKLRQILSISCFVCLGLGFITLAFTDSAGVHGIKKYEQIEAEVKQRYPGSYYRLPIILKEETEDEIRVFKVNNMDLQNEEIMDLFISVFDKEWNVIDKITAPKAIFLEEGIYMPKARSTKHKNRRRKILLPSAINYDVIAGKLTSPDKIQLWTLKKLLGKFELAGLIKNEHMLDYLRRFSRPLIMCVMNILAACFIIIYRRSTLPKRVIIGACIVVAGASAYIEIATRMLIYDARGSTLAALALPALSLLIFALAFYSYRFRKVA